MSQLLTPRWRPLRPHAMQTAYFHSPHRFNTLPCGRRSGKTELAKRKLVSRAAKGTGFDGPRFFAGAPTRDQAKRIYWQDLKSLVPKFMMRGEPSESELVIRIWPDIELHVIGMDKPERIEGSPWDGGILDEYANMKAKAWGENVRPALADRNGWCDLIGVPEGRNHYYDTDRAAKAQMLELGAKSEWGSFSWLSADILPAAEIAAAKRDLDELTFQQEYEASFVSFEGLAYYAFNEKLHCTRLQYDPKQPLVFALDFNVAPGTAVVAQEQKLPNGLAGTGIIGEVHIPRNSNTPAVCRKLLLDWGKHQGAVKVYGDATGGNKGTAKVEGSDWDLVRSHLRKGFPGEGIEGFGDRVSFHIKAANPAERARVNAVNTRLKTAAGEIRCMIDPSKAPNTVKDFEGVQLLKGGSGEIDKKANDALTHLTDGFGYYVEYVFPVVSQSAETVKVTGT